MRRGVRFPLLEAGMAKAEIRAAARQLGLANWNKPSFACLSSRIPHGTEVTIPALSSRTTTLTFPTARTLMYMCHLPGHEQYGMVGVLVAK